MAGKRRGTGRTNLAQRILLGKRQLPVRFPTEQGKACVVERKTTWEGKEAGQTRPQARAVSSGESPVPDHPAGVRDS